MRKPLTSILMSSVIVVVIITVVLPVFPVAVGWIIITMPGLGSLVFWWTIPIRILLRIVIRVLMRVLWSAEMGSVALILMGPVPVPLSGVR